MLESVKYKLQKNTPFCLPFGLRFQLRPTSRESHAKAGKPMFIRQRTLAEYPIFRACQPLAGCQGLAVVHYGFALARLESGASSIFAQLGLYFVLVLCPRNNFKKYFSSLKGICSRR